MLRYPKWPVFAAPALVGCIVLNERAEEPQSTSCREVLEQDEALTHAPGYTPAHGGSREVRVANCYLELRRPEKAVELAHTWTDAEKIERTKVEARAKAQLGDEEGARPLLEEVARNLGSDLSYFLDPPEFHGFTSQDWFVRIVAAVWGRHRPTAPDEFANQIANQAREKLLPLKVAAADAQRPTGELALWTGYVQNGKLDRAGGVTVLQAEGVEVKNTFEGQVVRETQTDSLVPSRKTVTKDLYSDRLIPTGHSFLVRYPKLNEQLVGLHTIVVFGRYVGRGSDQSMPVLDAFFVVERQLQENVERER